MSLVVQVPAPRPMRPERQAAARRQLERIAATPEHASSPLRGRHGVRYTAAAVVAALLVVGGGNVAYAAQSPGTVPAVAIPAPAVAPVSGTFVPVANVSTGTRAILYLAGDPSRASYGCVSLTARTLAPPDVLPDNPQDAAPADTFCAPPTQTGTPGVGYEDAFNPQTPGLGGQQVVAFGFVPAGTATVRITLAKRGPAIFRLLKPTTTVQADVFGADLHLPVEGWEGPDLSGYTVKTIEAIGPSGAVLATLAF